VLPTALSADVFEYLSADEQTRLLDAMRREEAAAILNEMSPDDRTALLEELPPAAVTRLLSNLEPKEREIAQRLLGYPENTVGRLMTTEFLTVRDDWTVARVLDEIRRVGRDREYLNILYVTDDQGRLCSDVRLREFVLQPADRRVAEFRPGTTSLLRVTDSTETAVALFRRYDRTMLPVVDSRDHLVGVVTADDMLDVAEAEATHDIHRLGGQESFDRPYLRMPVAQMIRKRAGWLVVLFLGEMLTATAMGHFEDEIARAVVLALFVPLIISSGGNSGSQAATIIIRALALRELELKDWWRVLRRELASGVGLGAALGLIGFARIALWSRFTPIYGPHWIDVAITVGFALIGVVTWGCIAGSMLPFLLKRCGADPATSSAPFVATLVDVTGLVIYFSLGYLMLRGTLL
jgi:magnesium transporter